MPMSLIYTRLLTSCRSNFILVLLRTALEKGRNNLRTRGDNDTIASMKRRGARECTRYL